MRTQLIAATVLVLACRASAPAPELVAEPEVTPVRVAPPDSVVSCSEWVQRAVANPELDVTRVAEPKAYEPAPIPRRVPNSVYDKTGKAEISITVMVDTLGKADMRSFTVVKTTSPRLTTSVRAAVAKWVFTPAEVMGCKVPRLYKWGATATRPRRAAAS
jgi:hypothetical protein